MHLTWQPVQLAGETSMRSLSGSPIAAAAGPAILTSVTAAETAELQRLAKGASVLEVGSANGYSAIVMALAGAQYVIAVDDHNGTTWLGNTHETMRANLAAYGVEDKVSIWIGNSRSALPQLAEQGEEFGFIFIDGDHTLDGAMADIENGMKMLADGGTIAIHDFLEHCCCPDVMFAVNRLFPDGPDAVVDTMAIITP